jgi:hypothetical protein
MRFLFAFFALAPALFFYSLAYLIKHPADWTGPAVLLPVSLAVFVLTYFWGRRQARRETVRHRKVAIAACQIGGIVTGLAIFIFILNH